MCAKQLFWLLDQDDDTNCCNQRDAEQHAHHFPKRALAVQLLKGLQYLQWGSGIPCMLSRCSNSTREDPGAEANLKRLQAKHLLGVLLFVGTWPMQQHRGLEQHC